MLLRLVGSWPSSASSCCGFISSQQRVRPCSSPQAPVFKARGATAPLPPSPVALGETKLLGYHRVEVPLQERGGGAAEQADTHGVTPDCTNLACCHNSLVPGRSAGCRAGLRRAARGGLSQPRDGYPSFHLTSTRSGHKRRATPLHPFTLPFAYNTKCRVICSQQEKNKNDTEQPAFALPGVLLHAPEQFIINSTVLVMAIHTWRN